MTLDIQTLSLGQLILRDNFDDDAQGSMWRTYAEDPTNCLMKEVNQRLELHTQARADGRVAAYVADAWRLASSEDFSMRVDFHYDLMTDRDGWVGIGLAPHADDLGNRRLSFGVGCGSLHAYYWHEKRDGYSVRTEYASRPVNDGVLYLSYNAAEDILYLGDAGYGPEDAWGVFTGLLKDQWGGKPVLLWLGGSAEGFAIKSGRAYVDNVLIESGNVVEAALRDVYRFWSPTLSRHFFTMSKGEKEKLLTQYAHLWIYEGVVYRAFPDDSDQDCRPIYRFWSNENATHFYTIREAEKSKLLSKYPDLWSYEGVAFYAYPEGRQPSWALPVYRFWSESKGTHFFTMAETEKDRIIKEYSDVWTFEGIAWYANE